MRSITAVTTSAVFNGQKGGCERYLKGPTITLVCSGYNSENLEWLPLAIKNRESSFNSVNLSTHQSCQVSLSEQRRIVRSYFNFTSAKRPGLLLTGVSVGSHTCRNFLRIHLNLVGGLSLGW